MNLIISDRSYAEEMLKRVSYYALISGYKKLFRNPTTRKYKDNTTFEEIIALYKFDESLRELFLKYLLQIEQTMRSLLSYDKVNEKELVQYLKVLTKFRNICAHNDRLFSFTTKDDIPDTTLHSKLSIAKKGTQYIYGKRDLFSVVIAFRYLLRKDDFSTFKSILGKTIDQFISQTTHVTDADLLFEMGFPANWKRIS